MNVMRRWFAVTAVAACLGAVAAPTTALADEGGRVLKGGVVQADGSFICFFDGMDPVAYETEVGNVDGLLRIITDADGNWVRGVSRGVYDAVEYRLAEGSQSSGAPDPVFVTGVQLINGSFNEEGQLERVVVVVPKWELRDSGGQLVDSGGGSAVIDETGAVARIERGACPR